MVEKRVQRVNSLIKREIAQIILRELEFPLDTLVTVTRVETSANLIDSNIWVSVLPEREITKIINYLNRKVYFLQQKLNRRLRMRPIPKIKFLEEDRTFEAGKIEGILEGLRSKR